MTRSGVFEAWTKHASTDLSKNAPTHGRDRGNGFVIQAGTGAWRASAVRVDISRELFRSPAGWSARSKDASAWIGHRFVRLCLLEDPAGARMLFGVMDALAGSRWLAEGLGLRLGDVGLDVARVFLACTHTHGAAGSMFGDHFYDSFASGLSERFDALGTAWMEDRLVAAVRGLSGSLEPVTLASGEGLLPHGLLFQRAIGPYLARFGDPASMTDATITQHSQRAHPVGWEPAVVPGTAVEQATLRAVDPRVPVWTVRRADGSLLFAAGTVHATGSLLQVGAEALSSDVLGVAALRLEETLRPAGYNHVVVALAAGAHGDTNIGAVGQRTQQVLDARASKRRSAETLARVALRYMRHSGHILADRVATAIGADTPVNAGSMELRFAEAFAAGAAVRSVADDVPFGEPPSPMPVRHLPTQWDFGGAVVHGSEFSKPDPDDEIYGLGSRERVDWIRGHVDKSFLSKLTGLAFLKKKELAYSPFVPLRVVRIGPLVWVGVSAEPSLPIADRISALFPGDQVCLYGATSGYCGYADTVAAGQMKEYEAASSYWGRDFGAFVVQQVERLRDAVSFHRTVARAPAPDEWLCGGVMPGATVVRGRALFSLGRRASAVRNTGPGRPLSGAVAGFATSTAIPVTSPLPQGGAWSVRGHWRPANRAEKRHGREDVSWPRVSEHGPRIAIDLEGGGKVFSDTHPMLVRWDGDLWVFEAELDRKPVRFTVMGHTGVLPIGSAVVPFSG